MRIRHLLLIAPLVLGGCGYNTIQSYDERAARANQDISVQLQRRVDLIGNLVETVKGQAKQELEVFTQVARARSGLSSALEKGDLKEMASANDQLTTAVRGLNIAVEAYPQIKSDQAFLRLQDELTGTENRIATARKDYNAMVEEYNAYIRRFPQVLTAKVIGSKARDYFEASAAATGEAPKVDFSK
jgi:LemA protein